MTGNHVWSLPLRVNKSSMAAGVKEVAFLSVSLIIFFGLIKNVSCQEMDYEYVTCGSTLKLMNTYNNVRLHSHDVKYGSGSGQQSVTAVDSSDDHNSYWQIRAKSGGTCTRGSPVKCGSTVRLTHLSTKRNLHSHHFQSPLSHHLEVSAFGEEGEGDEGDNWVIVCSSTYWNRRDKIRIKNVVTSGYLHVTGDSYGRPIHGQKEVCGYPQVSDQNYWRANEGIYIKPAPHPVTGKMMHDEL